MRCRFLLLCVFCATAWEIVMRGGGFFFPGNSFSHSGAGAHRVSRVHHVFLFLYLRSAATRIGRVAVHLGMSGVFRGEVCPIDECGDVEEDRDMKDWFLAAERPKRTRLLAPCSQKGKS